MFTSTCIDCNKGITQCTYKINPVCTVHGLYVHSVSLVNQHCIIIPLEGFINESLPSLLHPDRPATHLGEG